VTTLKTNPHMVVGYRKEGNTGKRNQIETSKTSE